MLPDFLDLKESLKSASMKMFSQSLAKKAPVLAQAREFFQHEGRVCTYQTEEGEIKRLRYRKHEVRETISVPELTGLGADKLQERVARMAAGAAEQLEGVLFTTLNQTVEKSGNVVDAKGKPMSPDLILELLGKMEIDFDEDGKPRMPIMVLNPKQFEKIKDRLREWDEDTALKQKFEKLIEAKRVEWRDREGNRQLVG